MSGGLVLAHYKANLRDVLEAARSAEKAAKGGGRDRLVIAAMRRSGEHTTAHLTWDKVPEFCALIRRFSDEKNTDRWAYQLRAVLDSGALQSKDMVDVEVARLLSRSEKRAGKGVEAGTEKSFHQIWKSLAEIKVPVPREVNKRGELIKRGEDVPGETEEIASCKNATEEIESCKNAVMLILTASFMARGREE